MAHHGGGERPCSNAPRTSGGLGPLGDALARTLAGAGGAGLLALGRLEAIWPAVVGETLASHSQPVEITGGRLVIAVPNPTWNTTLRGMERRILEAIQDRCPELGITSLRIVLGQRPRKGSSAGPSTPDLEAVELPAAARREIEATVAPIEDPELRARVAGAMLRQQQWRQWRLAQGLAGEREGAAGEV